MGQWFQKRRMFEMLPADSLSRAELEHITYSSSHIRSLVLGTGYSIYRDSILPTITSAEREVIIVTCFWAQSSTLEALNDTLRELSAKCVRTQTRIRVRINFSSSSLFQKLFHTTSLDGYTYNPSEWKCKLRLPHERELTGLDLEVKSIFVLPFSVMHPKFIIVDRSTVFLPSCNISWENWFEGSVQLSGPVTECFFNFWRSFWASDMDRELFDVLPRTIAATENSAPQNLGLLSSKALQMRDIESIFLPSPHHRNPQFALPWRSCPDPPPTPLNEFILKGFTNAKKSIYIHTPNLTSPPVLSALLAALKRGVDVVLTTSERLMILEQLLTAGTTTQRCIRKLVRRHKQAVKQWHSNSSSTRLETGWNVSPGSLSVRFYHRGPQASNDQSEPDQMHLKLTIVDDEVTILGSGNMDRASWYTSQELGVAFRNADLATIVKNDVETAMENRTRTS